MRSVVALIFVVGLAVVGCKTTSKSNIETLDVPTGLSTKDVEYAILAALETKPAEELPSGQKVADRALRAALWPIYRSVDPSDEQWFLEGGSPGVLMAGYKRGDHYLRVAIHYNSEKISFVVDGSRNLRESEGSIHKAAVEWIRDLEMRIRRSIGSAVNVRRTGSRHGELLNEEVPAPGSP